MGDALLATCLVAGLLLMSIVLLLCLKGRNRNQDDAHDYEPPERRRTAQRNQYMALQTLTPISRSTSRENPQDGAVPSYENTPASATVVEEGRQPSGNTGLPSNGVNNTPTGRQGPGSMRRPLQRLHAVEDESDVVGGSGPESAMADAGPPVVPPRRGASEQSSGGGEANLPTGVSDVTSSRDSHPDDAPQAAMPPPQIPRRLRRQEAISDNASVPGSSNDGFDNDAGDASEDRLQHPNGGVSGDHGNHTAGRRDSRHRQKRDFSEDLETVSVTPDGVLLSPTQPPFPDGRSHTFPRPTDTRGSPHVTRNDKFRTLGAFEEVIVGPDSVQILMSDPSTSGGASASLATQHSDRDGNSVVPPPVPRRPRQEGVGVIRLKR